MGADNPFGSAPTTMMLKLCADTESIVSLLESYVNCLPLLSCIVPKISGQDRDRADPRIEKRKTRWVVELAFLARR